MLGIHDFSEKDKREIEEFLELCEKEKNKNLEGFDIFVYFQDNDNDYGGISLNIKNGLTAIIRIPQGSTFRVIKDDEAFVINSIDNRYIDRFIEGEE